MGETLTLSTKDGHSCTAYLAKAETPAKGAIVVIQEIFGVNSHVRSVCDRFAKHGYTAIAPALFDRVKTGVELGYDQEGMTKGLELKGQVADDTALLDIEAAGKAVQDQGNVHVIGYCWGGTLAYLTACRLEGFSKAVGYYGGGIAKVKDECPQIPTMLHFGDQDKSIPLTDVDDIMNARPETKVFVYQAGHGFNCDARGSYDAPSAKKALERTLSFLEGK